MEVGVAVRGVVVRVKVVIGVLTTRLVGVAVNKEIGVIVGFGVKGGGVETVKVGLAVIVSVIVAVTVAVFVGV